MWRKNQKPGSLIWEKKENLIFSPSMPSLFLFTCTHRFSDGINVKYARKNPKYSHLTLWHFRLPFYSLPSKSPNILVGALIFLSFDQNSMYNQNIIHESIKAVNQNHNILFRNMSQGKILNFWVVLQTVFEFFLD